MDFQDLAGLTPEVFASLMSELAPLRTLEQVIHWGARRHPPSCIEDVVVQDEYTHDVVTPLGGGVYLAYDTN